MYTEEEAKKLWCPHVRLVQGDRRRDGDVNLRAPTLNRVKVYGEDEGFLKSACCIASKCMAWRWGERPKARILFYIRNGKRTTTGERMEVTHDMPEPPRPKSVPPEWSWFAEDCDQDAGWDEDIAGINARAKGFCGLAGRPD